MNDAHDKYKMFRNFMTNELGIGRDDIKAWTQEAMTKEVQRLIGQMNITNLVESTIRTAIRGSSYSTQMSDDMKRLVREAIAEEIAGKIHFTSGPTK